VLDYIERHKIGILSTIIIHLLLVTMFMVIQFGTFKKKKENKEVLIDFVDPEVMQKAIEQKKEEVKQLSQQELIKSLQKEYQIKNIAVNEAPIDAKQSVDKMIQEIKDESNIKDEKRAEPMKPQPKIEDIKKKDITVSDKKPAYNAQGERTFYKGATTISYFLEGRTEVYIPVPVYQCQGSGKVVMDIVVNQSGYVMTATVNKQQSQMTEECLAEAANRAALTTRFTAKNTAPDKQKGRITYIFIAQ
jgi:hypothetical protein